jgi:hypothetical protein
LRTEARMRRRRDGGAIVAELILVTMLVLIFVWWGMDYFRIGYRQRLTALGESQTKAWAIAYPNGPQCFTTNPVIGGPAVPGVEAIPSDLRGLFDGAGISSLFKIGYHTDQTAGELSGDALWTKNHEVRLVKGRTFLLCNEWVPPPDQDDDVYTSLHDYLMPH